MRDMSQCDFHGGSYKGRIPTNILKDQQFCVKLCVTLFISSAKPFSICFLSGSSHSVHSHFNFKRLNSILQDIYKAGSFHASS